ncbi:MAG: polysaccharide biosynthesis tyrosine autokinase [Bacteroidales bacterium]
MSAQNENLPESFNVKEFILQALHYKFFYIACFIICVTVAFFINRYSPTVYEVNSIIGPIEDRRNTLLGSNDLLSGLGAFTQTRNLENDVNTLKSFSFVASTVRKLSLEIGYYEEKNKLLGQSRQLYPNTPYTVVMDKSHPQPINVRFFIDILNEESYRLTVSQEESVLYNYVDNIIVAQKVPLNIDTICYFSEIVTNRNFRFSVSLNKQFAPDVQKTDGASYFEFYHLDHLAKRFLNRLKVEPVSVRSSLINVFFQNENTSLTIDFLNKFLETYLDENLSKKNKIAVNTINFIDSQISDISDSLVISESQLRDFRSAYQVTDLSYQGQQALQLMSQIDNDKVTLQVQERYYNYILDYFAKNQDLAGLAPPSSMNVIDPIMNSLILELLSLNAERSAILSNKAEKNLFLGQLENRINLQRQAITENVKNNLNTLNLTQNELNARAEKISRQISSLPRTELNMVSMQRKFNLTDAIYTFLLQKRSEAAIAMASNYPDYEILEPARDIAKVIVAPRKMINWMLAFFLAFMIPTAFIILKNFFNEKIATVSDAEHLLKRSVLSLIYKNNYKTEAVVQEMPGSSIAESFRNLRSSLFLKYKSEPLKIIMVTSSQPQDGKSFVAYNLAASIASVGNKSVIVDCDLRRPTLHRKFKIDNSKGLSNYMVDHTPKEEIILNTDVKNLSFIPAGPVLPNSSELIEAGALDEIINYLKAKYEYIIIDATPTGIVADATPLIRYASHILLICRSNHTRKDVFGDVLNMFRTNNIENFDVVFNDLDLKDSRYGRYTEYYKKA